MENSVCMVCLFTLEGRLIESPILKVQVMPVPIPSALNPREISGVNMNTYFMVIIPHGESGKEGKVTWINAGDATISGIEKENKTTGKISFDPDIVSF
jgi:hypothetical protein